MGYDHFAPAAAAALHDPVDFRAFFPYTPNEVKHRKRTTSAQLKVLENVFKRDTKPNAALRNELATQLDMTARGVQVWFQNRRAKEKTKAAKAAATAGGRAPSPALLALDDDLLDDRTSASPIQLPDASLKPPALHVVTDSPPRPEWHASPSEPPPDSAGSLPGHTRAALFAQQQSDYHNLRRGSLPVSAFSPLATHSSSALEASQWFDPLARRRSVDASLQRLAHNPYANLARTKNTALFGERFGMLSTAPRHHHHSRVSISRRPPLNHLASAPHVNNIRRSSMDARGAALSLRTNALSPAPTNPPPFISSRSSLPDHRLYAVTSRLVGSPIPGPLPSPNFSFGAASTPPMASPSSADSDRNSPDSLRSFAYPGNEDDGLSSPNFEAYSRFNSIASVTTSESSFYSDFGVDPLLPHAGSRRNSCSPGQFLDFVNLDGNAHYTMAETQSLNMGGFPSDEYGIPAPQGVTVVPESVSNSYPSPASTISAGGNSPHTLDSVSVALSSSNIPISKTSELSFALTPDQGGPSTQQYTSAVPSVDQQSDMNASLATASPGDDTSSSSSATVPQQHVPEQHESQAPQGQYNAYAAPSVPEFYTPDGRASGMYAAYVDSSAPLDAGVEAFQVFA